MSDRAEVRKLCLEIPRISDSPLELTLGPGDRVFLVGANGSGKSALVQHILAKRPGHFIERIPAHRRTWFHSDSVDITASARSSYATNDFHQDMEDQARWTDIYAQERLSAILFDLVDVENRRARSIAQYVDNNDFKNARDAAAAGASPLRTINELLEIGTLAVWPVTKVPANSTESHRCQMENVVPSALQLEYLLLYPVPSCSLMSQSGIFTLQLVNPSCLHCSIVAVIAPSLSRPMIFHCQLQTRRRARS